MSYLSVDNQIGSQANTNSSTALDCKELDVYNGTTNYHHITSASTAAPNNLIIPDANGEFVATTGNQTIQSKMFHSRKTSSFDPVYSFLGDTQTGMYWAGTNKIGFGTDAIEQLVISTIDIVSILPIKSNQFRSNSAFGSGYGTAGNVVYGLDGGTNGMYFGLNRINFSTNSAERLNIQDASMNVSVRTFYPDGTTALPSISFTNANTSGFCMTGSGRIAVSSAGSNVFQFANGGMNYSQIPLVVPNGTSAGPGLVGNSYTTTGFYFTAGPILNVSVGGTQRVAFETGGLKLYGSTAGNNALYVPTGLQYYEEATVSMQFQFPGGQTTAAGNVKFIRIGAQVIMQIPSYAVITNNSGGARTYTSTTTIPTRFQPSSLVMTTLIGIVNGANTNTLSCYINSGYIYIEKITTQFANNDTFTTYSFSMSWVL